MASDGNLGSLPFARGFGDEFVRRLEIVNRTVAAHGGLAPLVVAQNLDFLPASQIEAAVGIVRRHVLIANSEVPKLLLRHKVCPMGAAFFDCVLEDASRLNGP